VAGVSDRPNRDPLLLVAVSARLRRAAGRSTPTERSVMSDKHIDEAKGRVKEAAGSLTDDDRLKREGRSDKAKSSVKDKVDKVAEKAKDAVDGD
jgi:uncharacterized protein YjbJ (UPF0337 family)